MSSLQKIDKEKGFRDPTALFSAEQEIDNLLFLCAIRWLILSYELHVPIQINSSHLLASDVKAVILRDTHLETNSR